MKQYLYDEIPHMRVIGRTNRKVSPLTLFWGGSGIELRARATELWIRYHADFRFYEPWIDILVDDVCTQRVMLMKGTHELCVWRSNEAITCSATGEEIPARSVKILRDTQAMPLDDRMLLQIEALYIEGTLEPVPEPAMKLEFIGDSLTSGEGLCGAIGEQTWCSGCFDITKTYAVKMAHKLGADCHILSQSGWGVYRSFDGNTKAVLPPYYDQICGVLHGKTNRSLGASEAWDHRSWEPDVIVVNLGTNDGISFAGDGCGCVPELHRAGLRSAVRDFILHLRKVHPRSLIIWGYGMIGTYYSECLEREIVEVLSSAVEEAKNILEDENICYVQFPAMKLEELGSRSHPGERTHERVAQFLVDTIRSLKAGRVENGRAR